MESDDSDSNDDHTDKSILFKERIDTTSEEKKELYIDIFFNGELVGYMNAIIMDIGLLKHDGYVSEKLKCKDKESEEEILLFYNSLQDSLGPQPLFYITDFFLEKQYRGMHIGGHTLKALPNWLLTTHPEVNELYLFPFPLEKSNGKVECVKNIKPEKLLEMRTTLISFYISNGLQKTNTQFLRMPIKDRIAI